MALGNTYKVGIGSVGSYQISGVPWFQTHSVTNASVTQIDFQPDGTNFNVTRWIKIKNLDGSNFVTLAFSSDGLVSSGTTIRTGAGTQPWIKLPAGQTDYLHLELRVSSLFLLADTGACNVEIIAGLTPIQNDFSTNIAGYRGVGAGSI